MRPRWHVPAALAAAVFFVALLGQRTWASSDEFCRSEEFREAFLAGQEGIIIDYTHPSPKLIAYGNTALPCLKSIAEGGGGVFGIDRCDGSHLGCQGWAFGAIRLIGTDEARKYFLERLEKEQDATWLAVLASTLGSLREETARPQLRKLLQNDDPDVRIAAIIALAAIGRAEDLGAMAASVTDLPDSQVSRAVHGFRILGDEKAFGVFEARLQKMKDETARSQTERALASWKSAIAQEARVLTALRTESGLDLYKTIQNLKTGPRSDAVREALLPLLEHEDPRTRAASVRALSRFNVASDFERLLEVTLDLPCEYVLIGVKGIEQFNDPRAIEPLENYAAGMRNSQRRRDLSVILDRIHRRAAAIADLRDKDK